MRWLVRPACACGAQEAIVLEAIVLDGVEKVVTLLGGGVVPPLWTTC